MSPVGFKFAYLCDLLSDLEALKLHDPPLLPQSCQFKQDQIIKEWFRRHRVLIDAPTTDGVALLSALFPEKRTDRVYNLQPPSLTKVLGRCFGLGTSRKQDLERWKEPGRGDLATCVERVLSQSEFPVQRGNWLTLEQIDATLTNVAKRSPFSGPNIRKEKVGGASNVHEELGEIYRRARSREAKWLTRLILKDYSPVILPERLVLKSVHHMLPALLKVQDNFEGAVASLKGPVLNGALAAPGSEVVHRQNAIAVESLIPHIGTKVGRTNYFKGRSIKHTMELAHGRRMSLERKYDGEYCQIHVNLGNPNSPIRIFSKSGKDSTIDKRGIHDTLKQCLRIGNQDCKFSSKCILEGELVVWSTKEQDILEYHKIRKHITRSGFLLGTEKDSQAHPHENLMILFYDLLLVDDDPILMKPHSFRRQVLKKLVSAIPGQADLVSRQEITFSSPDASEQLLEVLADGFSRRWEGFVLKASDEPYFNFREQPRNSFSSCWIKLKKDYIPGLGDTADLAVVGAGYDAAEAARLGKPKLPWTHFHIGCLQNKDEVKRFNARPRFIVLDAFNQSVTKPDFDYLRRHGQWQAIDVSSSSQPYEVVVEAGLSCKMDVLFSKPFVFEVMGSGFDKPANRDHFLLRFPRLVKIHKDRDFKDTVSFNELQLMADEARKTPREEDLHEEIVQWRDKLRKAGRGKKGVASWENSQDAECGDQPLPFQESRAVTERARSVTAVPIVRVDSQEMLQTSDVSLRPSSRQSTSTVTTGSSVPTPPASSPEANRDGYSEEHDNLHDNDPLPSTRKRSRNERESREIEVRSKRARPSALKILVPCLSRIPPRRTGSLHLEGVNRPMRDITNSPEQQRPRPPHRSNKQDQVSIPALELVRKLDVGTVVRPTTRPRRKIVDSSPTRESTPSEHSGITVASTIPRAEQAQPAATADSTTEGSTASQSSDTPNLSPKRLARPTLLHPTLTSSSSSAPSTPSLLTTSSLIPEIPVFSHSLVLLSPCIAQMPYLTQELLPALGATVIDSGVADSALLLSLSSSIPSESRGKDTMVALVEPHRVDATAEFLRSLVSVVRDTGKDIAIWDWRLLEKMHGKTRRKKAIGKCYVGCMRNREGAEDILIHWKSGDVSPSVGQEAWFD